MVPLNDNHEAKEELNYRIYTLHKHTTWSYKRIAKELGFGKSRVQEVVKMENLWGG